MRSSQTQRAASKPGAETETKEGQETGHKAVTTAASTEEAHLSHRNLSCPFTRDSIFGGNCTRVVFCLSGECKGPLNLVP